VDLHRLDAARLGRSNLDRRLKVAIAVDPELTGAILSESVGKLSAAVRIVNLGASEASLDARALASRIPGAGYSALTDAGVFDSFAECNPQGPAILKCDGGEPALCVNGKGRPRATVHAHLASLIMETLRQSFPPR
jgi:predicted dienelactone hydrolase